MTATPTTAAEVNVAARLTAMAAALPDAVAVAFPRGYDGAGKRQYQSITFSALEQETLDIARGLVELGVQPGMRLALLVRPSIEFISLVFALLKSGAVTILIDPGMGRRNLVGCLAAAEPAGFVAIPQAQLVRLLLWPKFRRARINVAIGGRWPLGTPLARVKQLGRASHAPLPVTRASDPAAIIFTTGSTGPPKGVLYTHGIFDTQVMEIRDHYGIRPGEIDLPGFPLFGLFNSAMGVTTVIPDMDPTRPAQVDPVKIIEAVRDWQVTQAFGSPAIWRRVGQYCVDREITLPTLRRVLSAGAPVPTAVLARMKHCMHPDGEMHTPYGATEALPVASISASEVLQETSSSTAQGAGVCVGRRFPGIEWQVVRIVDGPIGSLAAAEPCKCRQIGELIVSGPVVTREYATRREWNALAKIPDGERVWHRMGDVGYLDEQERFWFCGRAAHRVETAQGTLYTVRCEAIYNAHESIYRTALVGIGPAGNQQPVIVAEPLPGRMPVTPQAQMQLVDGLRALGKAHPLTESIEHVLLHPALPVDIRHNAKIFREQLAPWAAAQLKDAQFKAPQP